MWWLIGGLLGLVAASGGGLLAFTWKVARGLLRPVRKLPEKTPQEVGLVMEDVRIAGPRGALAAWYLPARNNCTLICLHGVGDHRGQWLEQVSLLHNRGGYGALLLDFPAHGESEGDIVTYGVFERDDVEAAVEWLRARGDVDMRGIGVMGYSLGAITATLAAASIPDLRALIIESGFADLPRDIGRLFSRFTHLPSFPFARLVIVWGEWMAGARLSQIRPARVIGQISPRATLIISDLADGLADEPYDGETLYAAAGEPKELWQVAESSHINAFWRDPASWLERVGDFLDRNLASQVEPEELGELEELERRRA
ncbi:MAG TPA: alpha/beta fold hydrolase [Ktedonobacterales bacterium]